MAKLTDKKAFEGETLTAQFIDPKADSVSVTLKDGTNAAVIAATKADGGVFNFSTNPEGFSGLVRWIAMANREDGKAVIANGTIYIRPLVSKYREVVDAIDEAIRTWATNPNHTVTCGEISITAKSVQDLFDARAEYKSRAEADEAGVASAGGPKQLKVRF